VESQINNSVGVTPFVIVPGNELNEVRVKGDTSLGIEDGASSITNVVLRDDFFISVAQNTLKFTFSGILNGLAQFFVTGTLFKSDSQIDNGDIKSGDSERHTGQLALQTGDDLTDGLSGTSGGGDDVTTSSSTGSPVLTTLGGTIDNQLSSSGSVNGGHETFEDAVLVVDNLSEGSKTVGGAGSVRDDVKVALVFLFVDTHNEHGGIILGRSRHDNLGDTIAEMGLALFLGEVDTGAFKNSLDTSVTPINVLDVLLVEDLNSLTVDDKVLAIVAKVTLEFTVDGVVLKLIDEVVETHERVVDSSDFDLGLLKSSSEGESSDSSETVNTNLDHF